MEKTSINQRESIITNYMHFVLEHGKKPHNVFKFAKENEMSESEFYAHFPSFEELEKEIFCEFFKKTLGLLDENKEYQSFDAQNKLLSFYFTFFELLTKNRSYVIQAILHEKVKGLGVTSRLKKQFKNYIHSLEIETLDLREDRLETLKEKGIAEVYWGQFAFIMNYWQKDTSSSFEKTDILIEKIVNTSFQLQDMKPLQSVLDLGKFLLKEFKK